MENFRWKSTEEAACQGLQAVRRSCSDDLHHGIEDEMNEASAWSFREMGLLASCFRDLAKTKKRRMKQDSKRNLSGVSNHIMDLWLIVWIASIIQWHETRRMFDFNPIQCYIWDDSTGGLGNSTITTMNGSHDSAHLENNKSHGIHLRTL